MPADGHGLLPGEADEPLAMYTDFSRAVGKGSSKLVGGHLLPLPGGVILTLRKVFL